MLAKWLLLVGAIATFSGTQSLLSTNITRKVYVKGGANGEYRMEPLRQLAIVAGGSDLEALYPTT